MNTPEPLPATEDLDPDRESSIPRTVVPRDLETASLEPRPVRTKTLAWILGMIGLVSFCVAGGLLAGILFVSRTTSDEPQPGDAVRDPLHQDGASPDPVAKTAPRPESEKVPPRIEPKRAAASDGYGSLNINSRPFGIPSVDGRQIASETPVAGYRLPAGVHKVSVYFPREGRRIHRIVRIQPNESTGVSILLPDE